MGVKIKKNKRSGKLAFRLFWQGLPGGRSWETTELEDTRENRAAMQRMAALMAAEMANGSFEYLKYFPQGAKAAHFAGQTLRRGLRVGASLW